MIIPPYQSPASTEGAAIAAYLTKHVGGVWYSLAPCAMSAIAGIRVDVYAHETRTKVLGAYVTLTYGPPHEAVPILRNPDALRARVRELREEARAASEALNDLRSAIAAAKATAPPPPATLDERLTDAANLVESVGGSKGLAGQIRALARTVETVRRSLMSVGGAP